MDNTFTHLLVKGLYVDNIWIINMRDAGDTPTPAPSEVASEVGQQDPEPVCPTCGHGHTHDIDRFEHWLGDRWPAPWDGHRTQRCPSDPARNLDSGESPPAIHRLKDHAARSQNSRGPRLSPAKAARQMGDRAGESDSPDVRS